MAIKSGAKLKSVAEHITHLLVLMKNTKDPDTKSWCTKILQEACRQLELFVKPEVSIAADSVAKNLHPPLEKDLSEYIYKDLKNINKRINPSNDKEGENLHWEHIVTVYELSMRLLKLKFPTPKSVLRIIKMADVAWVTKEEDKRLEKKYRYKRPNSVIAYDETEIKLRKQKA